MSTRHSIWIILMVLLGLSGAWAQDAPAPEPSVAPEPSTPQQPVPAYGPDNSAPAISENPPISGLDLPNLEPHSAPLSYLQLGAHFAETADSNIEDTLGGSEVNSISRAEGSLTLQRLWSHYTLALDYAGGVGYYNAPGIGLKQVEELGFQQKINWKRGELGIRDAFSYQPEGNFGASYGAEGVAGAGLGGVGALFPGTVLGELGQVPRILNVSAMDVVETLTPKSSITLTGAYGFVHFLGNDPDTGTQFIGSSEITAELGYDRILGPRDQAAIVYAYQGFQFSTPVTFNSNVIQLMWGHRISGRMDFLISAGPQFTQIYNIFEPATPQDFQNTNCQVFFAATGPELECPTNDFRIATAGRALLRYQFPRWNLNAGYQHYLTSGSGFFAGAESDVAHLSANRALGRIWNLGTDVGYSRNSRVASGTCATSTQNCQGVNAAVYQYGFAGFVLSRMFGRNFHAYTSYQFNDLFFDSSYCQNIAGPCNRTSQRQVGSIGLDWIPRPIRID
jgi:hypothetical protein